MEYENNTPAQASPCPPQYAPYVPQPRQEPPKKTPLWKILVPVIAAVLVIAVALGAYFLFFADTPAKSPGANDPSVDPQTADIVGTWRFDGAYVGDRYYYAEEADGTLSVRDDGTASLDLGGEITAFKWKSAESTDRDVRYTVRASDGTVCEFWLVTDPEDEDYGVLLLYGNQENIIYFVR